MIKKTLFFGVTTFFCAIATVPSVRSFEALSPRLQAEGEHQEQSHESHGEGMPGEHGEPDHQHQMMAIPEGQPVPAVKLIVHEDLMQGWNLELQVENFQFAPEHIDQPSIPTEGHAHLYVNGKKIARLYGNWYHLPELPPGMNEVTVSLNANGHEILTFNGQAIQDTVTIEVN